MRVLILIGMLSVAFTLTAGETIYQWTDKDGNIHFSESPPPAGTRVVQRDLEPMPKVGTVEPYLDADESKQATGKNDELAQRPMGASTNEEQHAIECDNALDIIGRLSTGRDTDIVSPDGTGRVMSEAERLDRIRVSQIYIDENCQ